MIDADAIFGIPSGAVDLQKLLPLGPNANSKDLERRMRPRSSSATWDRKDRLRQSEIDDCNARQGIKGRGIMIRESPARSEREREREKESGASGSKRSPLSQRHDAK